MRDNERFTSAVDHADAATGAWAAAARAQRAAAPEHGALYRLAGELEATLHVLTELTCVLAAQVEGYGQTRSVYDDTHTVDPHSRLAPAAADLRDLTGLLEQARRRTSTAWSALGHIGIQPGPS